VGTGFLIAGALVAAGSVAASAETIPGSSGDADRFSVLAGATVTDATTFTGAATHVWGDVGVSPGTAIGLQSSQADGAIHSADTVASKGQTALTAAYLHAAGLTPTDSQQHPTLGGLTFGPGVYNATSSMDLTGTVTLDGHGDPAATWVFQAGTTLVTASSSRVLVLNGNPCNVYWQVGSSATLGSSTSFIGTVMADQSITAVTNANIVGRLLARNAAVTLDSNQITQPLCRLTDASGATVTATPSTSGGTATPGPSGGTTATPAPSASASSSTPAPSASPSASGGAGTGTGGGTGSPAGATPTPTPTPTRKPGGTPTPTASTPGGGGSGPTSSTPGTPDTLASTGSDIAPALSLAGGLLAAGGLLIVLPALRRNAARRRATARS
jgi:hypothetical protein